MRNMEAGLHVGAKRATIIIAIIFFTLLSITSCSIIKGLAGGYADHFSTCFYYKGQWSSWENHYFPSSYMREYDDWKIYALRSSENHIIGLDLRDSGGNTYFSFRITDYVKGKKDCNGTVEYYVNDAYPTAEALAKSNFFVKPDYRTDITPSVKRTARARIKIVNDGSKPEVFNLWYDNIGVGISVRDVHWN